MIQAAVKAVNAAARALGKGSRVKHFAYDEDEGAAAILRTADGREFVLELRTALQELSAQEPEPAAVPEPAAPPPTPSAPLRSVAPVAAPLAPTVMKAADYSDESKVINGIIQNALDQSARLGTRSKLCDEALLMLRELKTVRRFQPGDQETIAHAIAAAREGHLERLRAMLASRAAATTSS